MPTEAQQIEAELIRRELLRREGGGVLDKEFVQEGLQDFASSAGRGAAQIGRGAAALANQLGIGGLPLLPGGEERQDEVSELLQQQQQASNVEQQAVNQRSPVAGGVGQLAPILSTAAITGGSSLPGQLAANAGIGGVIGASQNLEDPSLGAATGAGIGAVGTGVGALAQRGILGLTSRVQESLRNVAQRTGATQNRLASPGALSGSQGVQQIENTLGNTIGGRRGVQSFEKNFQAAVGRQASKAIGRDKTFVNLEELQKARAAIGKKFNRVREIDNIQVPDDVADALFDASARFDDVNPGGGNPIEKAVTDLIDSSDNGFITGADFDRISKRLRKIGRQKANQDFALAEPIIEAGDVLDDLLDASAPPDILETLQEARQQWKNLLALEGGAAINKASGDINAKTALSNLVRIDKQVRNGNRQDAFTDLLTLGNAPKVANPNSAAGTLQLGQLAGGAAIGASLSDDNLTGGALGATLSPVAASALTRIAVGGRGGPLIGSLTSRTLQALAEDENTENQ